MRGALAWSSVSAAISLLCVDASAETTGDACQLAPSSEPSATGPSLGLRVGYAFPTGSVTRGDAFRDNLTGMIPIWLDAGYRLSRPFYLGAYFQWAPAFVADGVCSPVLSCSAYDVRFGVNVHWHMRWMTQEGMWKGPIDPWIGLGTGYESAITH